MDSPTDNIRKQAENWLQANNSKFNLVLSDLKENRLVFENVVNRSSFIIICPEEGESWNVCSEQEQVLEHLQDVMEYLDSRANLSIDTVLERVTHAMAKISSKRMCQDEDSDEDGDDNFEDAEDGEDEDGANVDEDDEDFYYLEEDTDTKQEDLDVKLEEEEDEDDDSMQTFFEAASKNTKASVFTIKRLCKDMRSLTKTGEKYGFSACPDGSNLFIWKVRLLDIPADTKLGKDLEKYAQATKQEKAIQMEMQFPDNYPYSPPFLRVIRPRFQFLTGHVTVGGSICMQMLTKSGWRPSNDIEGILVQVRSEILSDPNAALDQGMWKVPYTLAEAKDAFSRMVARYGWDK